MPRPRLALALALARLTPAPLLAALGALGVLAACAAKAPPPPPALPAASASAPPAPYVGALVRLPKDTDRASLVDRPVRPDGRPDVAFRVRLAGPVRALYWTKVDAAGRPIEHLQWDTRTGDAPFPTALASNFGRGRDTAVIAVVDAKGTLLNPDGELPETVFHDEEVTLSMSDPAGVWMTSGSWTLWVERPSGALDRTTTVLL